MLPAALWVLSIAVAAAFVAITVHGLNAPARDAETAVLELAARIESGETPYPDAGDEAPAPAILPESPAVASDEEAMPVTLPEAPAFAGDDAETPATLPEAPALAGDDAATPAILPGAPAVVAIFVNAFGASPWQPRIIALLATLVTALLVTLAVRAETANDTIGVAAGGVFLAARLIASAAPGADVVEASALCLVVAGFVTLRFARGPVGTITAAALLAGAGFTHLMAVWFLAAALAHSYVDNPRRGVALTCAVAVFVAVSHAWMSRSFGPSFGAGVWQAAQASMRFQPEHALELIGGQLLGRLGVLTLVGVLTFALPVRPWRGAGGVWMWLAAAALAAALATSQSTAWALASLPVLAALVLLGPISLQRVTRHLSAWPGASRLGGQDVVFAGLALQFLALLSALPAMLRSG